MKHSDIIVIVDRDWINLPVKQVQKLALKYCQKNFRETSVFNSERKIKIKISISGIRHAIWGRPGIGYEKLIVLKKIDEIIRKGTLRGWGFPDKNKDSETVVGFMRFVSFVRINDRKHRITFDVKIDRHGNFYFDHNLFVENQETVRRRKK